MTFLVNDRILSVCCQFHLYILSEKTYMTIFLTKNLYFRTKISSLTPFKSQFVHCHASNNTTFRNIGGMDAWAARLLCNRRKYDHIIPLLRDVLHWLTVPLRVEFKICLLVYKSLHGAAPGYLREYCKETHSFIEL